jgi:alkaline phosphatase
MRATVVIGLALALACVGCATGPANVATPRSRDIAVPVIQRPQQESAQWWFRAGAASAHAHGAGTAHATNLILFIGDGMSLSTVTAARIFEGQRRGQSGEENSLSFESFPDTALSKTYETDSQTPDSAGTMTAMVTGAKTRTGLLSVGQTTPLGDCAAGVRAPLATTLELAAAAGLATGVVTTTRITHATPAATYAHVADRNWESDRDLSAEAKADGCRDIARQLVEFDVGAGIDVALGGGRGEFLTADETDPEYPATRGFRRDGRDLVADWRKRYPDGRYVWNEPQLAALDLAHTPRLLGLFEPDHMRFEHDRPKDGAGEPSLAQMTRAAITVLKRNPKGFFLMVEGGRIDHAHHAGNAYRALDETVAFSDAIRVATELTSDRDTLIVVTADHSHSLHFVGYPQRGNPILGKVREAGEDADATDATGLPYTTLEYGSGPGYAGASEEQPEGPKGFPHAPTGSKRASGRPDLRQVDTQDPEYLQEATIPLASETHSGEDVGVWASGPGAAAVRGTIEQNVIFHLMVQAQPDIVRLLCQRGDCEDGVPVRLPEVPRKQGSE